MADAVAYYERREQELGAEVLREVERQVMLRIIDQRWRAHLQEMDYLNEGINLRAMGQKDPLVEWQREGFEMFGQLMHGVAQDFVRYIMRVQVTTQQPEQQAPAVQNVRTSAPAEADGESGMRAAAGAQAARQGGAPQAGPGTPTRAAAATAAPEVNTPVVKSEWDKTPRNAPCPCGSGKKYKMCHGRG